jgi:hypothetical protein
VGKLIHEDFRTVKMNIEWSPMAVNSLKKAIELCIYHFFCIALQENLLLPFRLEFFISSAESQPVNRTIQPSIINYT